MLNLLLINKIKFNSEVRIKNLDFVLQISQLTFELDLKIEYMYFFNFFKVFDIYFSTNLAIENTSKKRVMLYNYL